uniref:RNA-directed DNA polymerase, eukaryota n=1 Tax=Tanacetum cinerariifolium TaxID=118510 RepID=A0A699H696_TANCI|nr:RNA-directed DNA polymerase, eukaryota [Tanacetum cinerariifolium]
MLKDIDILIDEKKVDQELLNKRMNVINSIHDLEKLEATEIAQKAKINPCSSRLMLEGQFSNKLRADQSIDLESNVTIEEIKRAVWDCEVADAVSFFYISGNFPKGGNFSFIALIPKMQDAKVVKDYKLISLIGSLYKIIAKILANRLVGGFGRAYDSVRWDYLDDVLNKFRFGSKWRNWIHNCLNSSKGSILVNGSPTREFQFRKGLKQGDPLSLFLFLLIMESLHLSFQNLVNEGLFKGVSDISYLHLSYLFYADDVIFMGEWSVSNINTLVQALDCFYKASGLRMNLKKSKLMGISVEDEIVSRAASKMGCCTLTIPLLYLGVKVGGSMSRIKAWDEIEAKLHSRLSKWKMKTLPSGADKMAHNDTTFSLHRQPMDGVEMKQFRALSIVIEGVLLHDMVDRCKWTLEGSGEFSVASARKFIDNSRLIGSPKKTRWIKMVPIKVNILAWKVQFDLLPTRLNLSCRGIEIQNICCPICNKQVESMNHLFFACSLTRDIYRKIALWWEYIPSFTLMKSGWLGFVPSGLVRNIKSCWKGYIMLCGGRCGIITTRLFLILGVHPRRFYLMI